MQSHPMMFEDMLAEGRMMVLTDVLDMFNFDDRVELVKEPSLLGLFCEAYLAAMDPLALAEFLDEREGDLLGALVATCLLERLPRVA